MKDTEHNRKTLEEALSRLPLHEPPAGLWTQIESELAREKKERGLQDALEKLPSYSPPPAVWEAIESGLEPRARVRLRRLAWPAAAAGIAILLSFFLFDPFGEESPQPVYTYAIEKANPELLENNWDDDEQAMKTVVEQFSRDPVAKRQDDYGRILDEWKELEEAKAEIRAVMDTYGKDARLVRQMSDLERERSRLIRVMAVAM